MSRSGYNDWDCEGDSYLYRANIDRALAGKRGQAMLKELLAALELMPEKKLVRGSFEEEGGVCAFGALGRERGVDMKHWDELAEDEQDDALARAIAKEFNIPSMLAREVMYENDEALDWIYNQETDEERWYRMRRWVASQIKAQT